MKLSFNGPLLLRDEKDFEEVGLFQIKCETVEIMF